MCHTILYQKSKDGMASYSYGMLRDSNLLVGCKSMVYDFESGKLISPFITDESRVPYEYKLNLFGDKIIVREKETEQEISLCIPIISPVRNEINLFRLITAGLHISPLFKFDNNTYRLLFNHSELIEEETNHKELVFIVAFEVRDILFFDGEDVSVKEFMLIPPDKIIKLLEKIEAREGISVTKDLDTNWLNAHMEIYSKIIEKLIYRR